MDRVDKLFGVLRDKAMASDEPHMNTMCRALLKHIVTLEDRIEALESPVIQENGFTIEHETDFNKSIGYYGTLYMTIGGVQYSWDFSDDGVDTAYKDKHWCLTNAVPKDVDAAARTLGKKLGWLK